MAFRAVKIRHQKYQHCQFLLLVKACMHEMATGLNDKSPSVMVWSKVLLQADVMPDGDPTLNNQGVVIGTKWGNILAQHLWTQNDKGYTSMQLIYTQWNAKNLERLLEQHLTYQYDSVHE